MPDKKIISKVMIHPNEYVTLQAKYYNDSDIGKRLSGSKTLDIADTQHSTWYNSNKEVDSSGSILNNGAVNANYIMVKNKTHNTVLLSLDGFNYYIKLEKNDVFTAELNAVSTNDIKAKVSSGTSNIEYIVAQ